MKWSRCGVFTVDVSRESRLRRDTRRGVRRNLLKLHHYIPRYLTYHSKIYLSQTRTQTATLLANGTEIFTCRITEAPPLRLFFQQAKQQSCTIGRMTQSDCVSSSPGDCVVRHDLWTAEIEDIPVQKAKDYLETSFIATAAPNTTLTGTLLAVASSYMTAICIERRLTRMSFPKKERRETHY